MSIRISTFRNRTLDVVVRGRVTPRAVRHIARAIREAVGSRHANVMIDASRQVSLCFGLKQWGRLLRDEIFDAEDPLLRPMALVVSSKVESSGCIAHDYILQEHGVLSKTVYTVKEAREWLDCSAAYPHAGQALAKLGIVYRGEAW